MKKIFVIIATIIAVQAKSAINVNVDWGVFYTYTVGGQTVEKCLDNWYWICKISFKVNDGSNNDLNDNYQFFIKENVLNLRMKNSMLPDYLVSKINEGDVISFDSGGKYEFIQLPNEVCRALEIEEGYKINKGVYPLDKSEVGYTTILFK